jgi:uncharacterized membrane protein
MTVKKYIPPKPIRILRNHARLFASIAIGLALPWAMPSQWQLAARLLLGFDIGLILYLSMAGIAMSRFDLKLVRQRCADQDEGALFILGLTVLAGAASLAAIVAVLGSAQHQDGGGKGLYFALAACTIVLSWVFIQVIFAFHYAHEFYGEGRGRGGGLAFPNDNRPDYWDFVYFSFVIGMTFQVSDVQVTSKRVRKTVVAHGVVAFFFNVAVLALAVNIGAGLI